MYIPHKMNDFVLGGPISSPLSIDRNRARRTQASTRRSSANNVRANDSADDVRIHVVCSSRAGAMFASSSPDG
jgi:hypothetical protein